MIRRALDTTKDKGLGGGNGRKGEAATKSPDAPAIPFAWYRILKTGIVLVPGENPPKGTIWSPLYRAPIHNEHPDTVRLRWVCDGMDGVGDRDFHAEACKLAGGGEPSGTHYLMAYRAIIDTMRHMVIREVPAKDAA